MASGGWIFLRAFGPPHSFRPAGAQNLKFAVADEEGSFLIAVAKLLRAALPQMLNCPPGKAFLQNQHVI